MQVYVQKSTRTTFPRRSSAVSGSELSQPVAPSKPGKWPSTGNGAVPAWRRRPNTLTPLPPLRLVGGDSVRGRSFAEPRQQNAPSERGHVRTFKRRHLPERSEARANLFTEQLRLFPSGEMPPARRSPWTIPRTRGRPSVMHYRHPAVRRPAAPGQSAVSAELPSAALSASRAAFAAACFFSRFRARRSWTRRSRARFAIVVCRLLFIEDFLSLGSPARTALSGGGATARAASSPRGRTSRR